MPHRFLPKSTAATARCTLTGVADATPAATLIQKGRGENVTSAEIPLLRQSERSTFKRCPQKWAWAYLEGLKPNVSPTGALWFGTGIHLVLAEWYVPGVKRGRPLAETWDEYTKDQHQSIKAQGVSEADMEQFVDARELGFNVLEQYSEEYQDDPHIEVIQPEQRFEVLVPHPNNPKKAIARNVGTFDMVYRDLNDGKIKMMDHKTAKAISFLHLTLDDQAGSYIAFGTHSLREAGVIGPREFIHGMEYNFIRKAMRDDRPENPEGLKTNIPKKEHYIAQLSAEAANAESKAKIAKLTLAKLQELAEQWGITVYGDVSKTQPTRNFLRHYVARTPKERNTQIRRVGAEVAVMDAFRGGKLPLIKNPTKDCTWDCDFFNLCELHEAGGDVEDMKRMAYRYQDPYHDHREGAENSKTSNANRVERGV